MVRHKAYLWLNRTLLYHEIRSASCILFLHLFRMTDLCTENLTLFPKQNVYIISYHQHIFILYFMLCSTLNTHLSLTRYFLLSNYLSASCIFFFKYLLFKRLNSNMWLLLFICWEFLGDFLEFYQLIMYILLEVLFNLGIHYFDDFFLKVYLTKMVKLSLILLSSFNFFVYLVIY